VEHHSNLRVISQRLTFIYLATYLLVGGLGLLVVPELTLRLLLSSGSYGDVMPRLVGGFMIALGGAVLESVRARDYSYYRYAITARIFIVVALTALYFKARDPLFLVLDAIVLVGPLPSIYVAVQLARPATVSSFQRPAG
jgi:uncharacterized protein YjeT (DUF2065 family)